MIRDAASLSPREAYHALIDTIVPRPIAWVVTRSSTGIANLAPFSFFMGVCGAPPTLAFSVAARVVRDGASRSTVRKDTLRNLDEHPEFIVHVTPVAAKQEVIDTSGFHPPELDEIELIGRDTVQGTWVDVPRIPSLPIAMECRVSGRVQVGDPGATLVLGEILGWHVDDGLVDDTGRAPSAGWKPLARLGVEGYTA